MGRETMNYKPSDTAPLLLLPLPTQFKRIASNQGTTLGLKAVRGTPKGPVNFHLSSSFDEIHFLTNPALLKMGIHCSGVSSHLSFLKPVSTGPTILLMSNVTGRRRNMFVILVAER